MIHRRCRAVLLGLGALSGAPLWGAVLYNFDVNTQGWVSDTSLDYNNNFGSPTVAVSPVHLGARALSVPLDFTDKRLSNIVNDAVYVRPGSLNLSGSAGVSLYVHVGQGAGNGNPVYKLVGSVYVKTGDHWTFKEGDQIPLVRNRWQKIKIDFAAKGVADINDIKEIGVHIYGGGYDSGTAVLTIDSVESGLGDDLVPPLAPTGLSASDAVSGNRISLSWSAVGAGDLSHYNIYRAVSSGSLASKALVSFAPAGQNSFTDVSVVDGIASYYMVTAVDKSGNESPASAEALATPSGPTVFSMGAKGMTFASWQVSQWLGLDSDSALDDLKATGANYVAVVVTRYMNSPTSNAIAQDAAKTASNAAVAAVIQKIHARGMKVMLKPHVDVLDGSWRGVINPSNPAAWFTSYGLFINEYASLAQANGVEMFCVGTELKSMTQRRRSEWTTIINGVKARFSGADGLIYSANANSPDDEFSMVEFWDQLDYVGVNLYFPLTSASVTTTDGLKKAWFQSKDNYNMLQALTEWNAFTGKNLMVTEIGYQSADGTNVAPFGVSGTFDPQEQKQAYEAAFAALNNRSWVKGLFWWTWDPNPNVDGYSDTGYSPQNKPVLDLLYARYGGETTRSFYNFESGVSGWVADVTGEFADNLSAPSTQSQGGSMALRYNLNLANKKGGIITDYAYVEPNLPKDLSGYTGLTASVMIPAGANIPAGTPAAVVLIVQSSSTYRWFQSNTFRNLVPGQWRDVHIDFSSANRFIGGVSSPGVPVEFLSDIRRIGVVLAGAASGSGSSTFYVDNVRATGEGTILGLSVGPAVFDMGTVSPLGVAVGATALQIENTGNVTSRYSLSCSNSSPGSWTPTNGVPGVKTFVLNARFNSSVPSSFSEADHAVLSSVVPADSVRFAGTDQRGDNAVAGSVRNLWLQFKAPRLSDATDAQTQSMTLGVTVEVQ